MSPRDEHPGLPDWFEEATKPVDPVKGLQAWLMGAHKAAKVEPSAEMRAAAQNMMELFTALREAGFTEAQAMKIVIGAMHRGQ